MAQPQLNYASLGGEYQSTLPPIKSQKDNLMIDPDDAIRASYETSVGKAAADAWASNGAIQKAGTIGAPSTAVDSTAYISAPPGKNMTK